MMSGVSSALSIFSDSTFWITAIAFASPLLFAALGALICGQTGVLSLNIEGVFTAGALAAFLTAYSDNGHWAALASAAVVGAMIGLLSGVLTSPLHLPQRISGFAMSLLVVASCQCVYTLAFPKQVAVPRIVPLAAIDFSWIARLGDIPYFEQLGRVLFHAATPTYLALLLMPMVGYVLYRTPLGTALRACGRNPAAISTQGRSVYGLQIGASMVGAAFMAVGGATLALTSTGAFSLTAVSGRGFAALMLALIASWRIRQTFFAVLAFAILDAYQLQLQQSLGASFAMVLLPLLPFATALVVLIGMSGITAQRFSLPPD